MKTKIVGGVIIIGLFFLNISPAFAQLGDVTPPPAETPPAPSTPPAPEPTPPPVTPPADTTSPVISAVAEASITGIAANVTWITNELAVSTFEYGTTPSYGSSVSISSGAAIGGTAVLTGLTAGTTYYYCIHATDASGNAASSCGHSFTTAAAPVVADTVPPIVSLATVAPIGTSTATVNWTTDELATAQIEYGTTASYGTVTSPDSTLALTHSVALSGLTPNTTYHYAIKTTDASNNVTTTADATFTTGTLAEVNIQAPADTIPPVISGVANTSLGVTSGLASFTIVWTTNELATSHLEYGLSQSYGSDATLPLTGLLAHTATLVNLAPETTYYYCITATDIAGNVSQSCPHSFTTPAAPVVADTNPPNISLITVAPVTTTSAMVNWTTNEIADTQVEYGMTVNYGSMTTLDTSLSLAHSAEISNLSPNTTYHYRVISKDSSGNGALGPDNTFTTDALPVQTGGEITPPTPSSIPAIITSIEASSVATSSAVIGWSTDMATVGTVSYGLSASYGLSSASPISQTSHVVTLAGLLPNTTYHYKVTAVNAAGDTTVSSDDTFTTPAVQVISSVDTTPPFISLVTVAPIATSSATVNWTVNEFADGQIYYGTTASYGLGSSLTSTSALTHSIALSSLAPDTTYHYQIRSRDAAGNLAIGSDDIFTTSALPIEIGGNTPAPASPLVISAIDTASVGTSTVTITWQTDLPSDSQVEYGVNSNFGTLSTLDTSLATSHSVTLSGLSENTNYVFRVKSQAVGAPAAIVSDNQEFNTLAVQEIIETTVPANISNVSATPASASLTTGTSTSATVTWSTDKGATSRVEYGVSTSYGQTSDIDRTLVTSHDVVLGNLEPATVYYYRVISVDSDGDITFSDNHSFTTASPVSSPNAPVVISAPVAITDIAVASSDSESATVAWNVPSTLEDAAAIYDIRYSSQPITDGNFAQATPVQSTAVTYADIQPNGTARTYIVTGLTPGTTYYFAIKSKYEGSAWSAISNIISTTLSATPVTPTVNTQPIGAPTEVTASGNDSQVTLNWDNPDSANFVRTIIVEKQGSYPTSPTDGEIIYDGRGETFTDIEAQNGVKDYYALYSYDQDGNYSEPVHISLQATSGVTETKVYSNANRQSGGGSSFYSGGSSGSGSGSRSGGVASAGQTIQPQTRLTKYSFPDSITYGDTGMEVQHLQMILSAHPDLYPQKLVTGYFGDYTKAAVQTFQAKLGLPVTGHADPTTATLLNGLSVTDPILVLQPEESSFDKDLSYGMTDPDVEALQHFLIGNGDYPEATISEFFGPLTRSAVIRFQQKYGITPAAGYVGIQTRTQIKKLLGL